MLNYRRERDKIAADLEDSLTDNVRLKGASYFSCAF